MIDNTTGSHAGGGLKSGGPLRKIVPSSLPVPQGLVATHRHVAVTSGQTSPPLPPMSSTITRSGDVALVHGDSKVSQPFTLSTISSPTSVGSGNNMASISSMPAVVISTSSRGQPTISSPNVTTSSALKQPSAFNLSSNIQNNDIVNVSKPTMVTIPPPRSEVASELSVDQSHSHAESSFPHFFVQNRHSSSNLLTVEDEVNLFLVGRVTRDSYPTVSILDQTINLSCSYEFSDIAHLVRRRQWNEVILLVDRFLVNPASPYSLYYAQFVKWDDGSYIIDEDKNASSHGNTKENGIIKVVKIQADFFQIIFIKLFALQKLKRFKDLVQEIDRLRLISCTDAESTTVTCARVPLTLQLYALLCKHYHLKEASGHSSSMYSCDTKYHFADQLQCVKTRILQWCNGNHSETNTNWCSKDHWNPNLYYYYKCCIDLMLSDVFTKENDGRLALSSLDDALESLTVYASTLLNDRNIAIENRQKEKQMDRQYVVIQLLFLAYRVELFSRQGRILLQCGMVEGAATVFQRARDEQFIMKKQVETFYQLITGTEHSVDCISTDSQETISDAVDTTTTVFILKNLMGHGSCGLGMNDVSLILNALTRVLMNEGLLFFARGSYEIAGDQFTKALHLQRSFSSDEKLNDEISVIGAPMINDCEMGLLRISSLDMERNLASACVINLSLCKLYSGKIRDAVNMIESIIREDPVTYLTECIVFNLCTLYELGYDTSQSERMKTVLQLLAKRLHLQDIGEDCFRIN